MSELSTIYLKHKESQMQELVLAKLNGNPEVFLTLQGEGISQGQPAIFVRLSLCNLQCVWCDTPYTWLFNKRPHNWAQPYKKEDEVLRVKAQQIVDEVVKYPCKRIVVTGGEPLLQQQQLVELFELLTYQEGKQYWFEIETNGTIVPTQISPYVCQYNVSPKLKSSGNTLRRDNEEAMTFFSQSYKSWFKFVIVSHEDLQEVFELISKYKIAKDKVILMPEGISAESLQEKTQWLAEVCKEKGFRFSTRLHILLYGSKKGT